MYPWSVWGKILQYRFYVINIYDYLCMYKYLFHYNSFITNTFQDFEAARQENLLLLKNKDPPHLYVNYVDPNIGNLSFYHYQKPKHRTQFTTALRDVKEAFRRGHGSTEVLGPIEAPPDHVCHWIPATTNIHSLFLCSCIHTPQNFRIISQHKIVVITFQYYLIYIPTG